MAVRQFLETPEQTEYREAKWALGVSDHWRPEYPALRARLERAAAKLPHWEDARVQSCR